MGEGKSGVDNLTRKEIKQNALSVYRCSCRYILETISIERRLSIGPAIEPKFKRFGSDYYQKFYFKIFFLLLTSSI